MTGLALFMCDLPTFQFFNVAGGGACGLIYTYGMTAITRNSLCLDDELSCAKAFASRHEIYIAASGR